jgi:hypothetical protein
MAHRCERLHGILPDRHCILALELLAGKGTAPLCHTAALSGAMANLSDCEELKKERDRVQQQLSGPNAVLTALAGVYRGAANREGRHVEVNYELAARSRHSQQSPTF